jgi:isoleucyl-tRNA synthetase
VGDDPNGVVPRGAPNPAIVIWTTTPWTIPANLALAVHPDVEYAWVRTGGETWLLASDLAESVLRALGRTDGESIGAAPGVNLVGLVGRHPLFARPSPVVPANYVTVEDGTGVVHTAPGHGKEDFETGREQGLEVLCPVDPAGKFTSEAGERFAGARILGGEADERVIEALQESGGLLGRSPLQHSYPHCWRCRNPLLFRATVQWFMSIDHANHRSRALRAIEATRWYPAVSEHRIASMVSSRPDWCLSRQRSWGVGIPAFYCSGCGKELLSEAAVRAVAKILRERTADAWYELSSGEILPGGFSCEHCGGTDFEKETDILDVWFDSGSTHVGVLGDRSRWPELKSPADVYLEGSDQHRGWFNSSLMISVGLNDRAPYDAVITNGWTLDEHGKAMHKSLGNAVSPNEVIETLGADILRLWVASTDYFEDVRCSESILKQVAETYRRIRNTFRFLVNNLGDFDPDAHTVSDANLTDLDRWALARLGQVVAACEAGYESYEFHRVYHAVHNFCAVDLSAFYLDVVKDRLYCSGAEWPERRAAQTTLYELAATLARLLAPVLSHTADEVWDLLGNPGGVPSAQLANFPSEDAAKHPGLLERWEPVTLVREEVNLAVEALRQEKRIGSGTEAAVVLRCDSSTRAALEALGSQLADVLKVSLAQLETVASAGPYLSVSATNAPGEKCARCWLIREDLGASEEHPELCGRCARAVAEVET